MIRIGVDAWNLPGDRRGIGRYVREILRAWWENDRDEVEVTLVIPPWHTWTVQSAYLREVDDRPYRVVSRRFHGLAGLDALWFPFNGCSWTNFSLPAVATLHDASNFVAADYCPQAHPIYRAAVQRCQALITDSRFAQDELARELGIARERLAVIPLGVAPPRPPREVALDVAALQPFVLHVGAADTRKGLDTLLAAMHAVQTVRPQLALTTTAPIDRLDAQASGLRVHALGFVDDDTLAALYRACTVFAFPSRYEGFGLPVLEAMSYGAPVVISDALALIEAAGDAALAVATGDSAALAGAIERIAAGDELANELRRRGRERAERYSWKETARATLAIFRDVLGRKELR